MDLLVAIAVIATLLVVLMLVGLGAARCGACEERAVRRALDENETEDWNWPRRAA